MKATVSGAHSMHLYPRYVNTKGKKESRRVFGHSIRYNVTGGETFVHLYIHTPVYTHAHIHLHARRHMSR